MADNAIFRSPNPDLGQGEMQAVSQATGWRYEHDETDEQINAIELLINQVRADSGAATDNDGKDENGNVLRGATFSWSRDEEGNVVIGTSYQQQGSTDWVSEVWTISPDGMVSEAVIS